MANIGSAAIGKTLIGAGNGVSPTFASIGTNSGLTAHGIVVAENLGAFTAISTNISGQILQSGGASTDPAYSTATYPSTAGTSGNVITSNGTNFVSQAFPAADRFGRIHHGFRSDSCRAADDAGAVRSVAGLPDRENYLLLGRVWRGHRRDRGRGGGLAG